MPLPTLPTTHRWVDGGLVAAVAGRSLTVPAQGSRIFVWDLDTDARVVDLYDQQGNAVDSIPLSDNTFRAGVPLSVVRPVFSVGQDGLRFAGTDWEAVANAKSAADDAAASAALVNAPADTAIATAVQGPGTQTKAALDAAYGSKAQQDANTDDIASLKLGGGAANKASRGDIGVPLLWEVDPTVLSGPVGPRLTTPTPDGSGQVTHPSVVFIPGGFNGYPYWMAYTPYPGGNDDYEDPCIVASHDGTTWVVPDGLTNPLDDADGTPEYNSDVNLVYGPDGRLYLFWRFYDPNAVGAEENFYLSTSEDGVHWSPKALILTNDQTVRRLMAPTVIYDEGRWVMWAIDILPATNKIVRLEAPAAEGPWSSLPSDCTISGLVSGKEPWHMEVRRLGTQYVALIAECNTGTSGTAPALAFATSTDGIAWTGGTISAIPMAQSGEHDSLYKSTFWPKVCEDGRLGFDVWYTGWTSGSPSVWHLYRTTVTSFRPSFYTENGVGVVTTTTGTGTTAAPASPALYFTAPPSGWVRIEATGYLKYSVAGAEAGMQIELRQGTTTVGTAQTVASVYDVNYVRTGGFVYAGGLTPGVQYNIRPLVRSGNTGTATLTSPVYEVVTLEAAPTGSSIYRIN